MKALPFPTRVQVLNGEAEIKIHYLKNEKKNRHANRKLFEII